MLMTRIIPTLMLPVFLLACVPAKKAEPKRPNPNAHSWRLHCSEDRMEGHHSCSIAKDNLVFALGKSETGYVKSIGFADKTHPREPVKIKIDGNEVITARNSMNMVIGEDAEKAYNQMLNGKTMMFRYYRWPTGKKYEKEIDIVDFDTAYRVMKTSVDFFQ